MKASRRASRMQRHHARFKLPALNLVSLMDIFTILVFFLLVSASEVQNLPSTKDLKLPTSRAATLPEETLVVMVTANDILVQGRKIADVSTILQDDPQTIPALEKELAFHAQNAVLGDTAEGPRKVTILADKRISYQVLRTIMATCSKAHYTDIALAVNREARDEA